MGCNYLYAKKGILEKKSKPDARTVRAKGGEGFSPNDSIKWKRGVEEKRQTTNALP